MVSQSCAAAYSPIPAARWVLRCPSSARWAPGVGCERGQPGRGSRSRQRCRVPCPCACGGGAAGRSAGSSRPACNSTSRRSGPALAPPACVATPAPGASAWRRHRDGLRSMPGVGVRTGARILIEVGDGSTFPTAGRLAAYAGPAPATRSSGSSIRGEQPSRRGKKQLKRAFFLAAFAVLDDPASRAYYDRKIAQASTTPGPCSALPGAGPTSSSPCSAMEPSTNPRPSDQAEPPRVCRASAHSRSNSSAETSAPAAGPASRPRDLR